MQDYICRENVTYCTHDGVELRGDLYLPKGDRLFPILIGVPGGGWRICVRASLHQWGIYLASRGYGLFVIDYRLATATRKAFPEAVQDVVAAVRFIRGSGAELSIDPQRIGLLGASAGAHLAALAALGGDTTAFGGGHPGDAFASTPAGVKVLVAVYGVFDLFRQWQDDVSRNPDPEWNMTRNLIGRDPYEDQRSYFAASPLRHVTYDKNRMSVFVSWGTSDEFVDPGQSESFVRALQQARFTVRTHKILGASHFWFGQSLDFSSGEDTSLAPRLVQFLNLAL
ncbi:Acetyl esterase/lipase [Bradyrhizobium sp. Rc3b]|uniref:alpha/beta hydrolase family protein n=1 Tax=Bradyrhizobium sp. Rc3b TaxID=1855322 RepID=UPI0008F27DF7|nr:alpha/beta hydrolase [Bradyrhizobium sp. Rc3b]SFM49823.1 Acetyl esterase/lipase [Bradyrhizobium sp. Rc3b]